MRSIMSILFALIVLFGDAHASSVCAKEHCVAVDIARTPEQLRNGLMYRDNLLKDQGMLFVFNQDDDYAFWMKNMRFAIDILWLDQTGKIVYMIKEASACKEGEDCPSLRPTKKARYVLEIDAGMADQYRWSVGDQLTFSGISLD